MAVAHTVLIKFKADVSDSDKKTFLNELSGLLGKIPGLRSVKISEYDKTSPEVAQGFNQGFTNIIRMKFDTLAARNNYIFHPLHTTLVETHIGKLENFISIDNEEVSVGKTHEIRASKKFIKTSSNISDLNTKLEKLKLIKSDLNHNNKHNQYSWDNNTSILLKPRKKPVQDLIAVYEKKIASLTK